MKGNRDAVIIAYGRSPLARAYKGGLRDTHPVDYGQQVLKGVLNKVKAFDYNLIEDIIVGCAIPEDYTGFNIARLIAQCAGLSDAVPGQTINRFCSSGLQSIATAANAIMAGQMDVIVAGGIERMTGINMIHPIEYQEENLREMIPGNYISMGITAENVAKKYGITREQMDAMAFESHQKAYMAQKKGKFVNEIIPISISLEGECIVLNEDEGIRPETTMDSLAKLKPCFAENGIVTAATSSQMTDGASFILMMSREKAEDLGYEPIAKFVSYAVGGVPAEIMGIGPIVAIPKVMVKSNLTIDDMDVIELNEAFAAQSIACIQELKLPVNKVNPNGGAMALGHPLGATGSVLTCRVLSELRATKGKYGLVTMCIGGGMGAAGIIEMEDKL